MKKTKMTNKYLTKVCALLRPPVKKDELNLGNLYSAKINLAKKLITRLGEGTHRQQKIK